MAGTRKEEVKMRDAEFRALLDLFMCCDPWPVEKRTEAAVGGRGVQSFVPDMENHETIRRLLDRKARRHGYENWVEAFHLFKVES